MLCIDFQFLEQYNPTKRNNECFHAGKEQNMADEGTALYHAQISAKQLRRTGGLIDVLDSPVPSGKKVDEIRVAIPVTVVEEHKDASGAIDFVKITYGPGWIPFSFVEKT